MHLICQDDRNCYLSIAGAASLVEDRPKIAELWQETFKVWFPEGKDDPEIVLISVQPDDAEYWDNQGWKKVKYLAEAARAYGTGETPEVDPDQRGRLRM